MRWPTLMGCVAGCLLLPIYGFAQVPAPDPKSAPTAAPLDATALLQEVERNQKRLEALKQSYTYHVHTERQQLGKRGDVKKTETEDAESLTIGGVRVDRIVARNGTPLTPDEQRKENERIDKDVAQAKARRNKIEDKGGATDEQGHAVLPLSRLLELGRFSRPRRDLRNGRPVIAVDYAGDPEAKTHSVFEGVMRDMVGTLWIDEADRVMTAAQGHFLSDFKVAGGLMADVRKGTSFQFTATRVGEGVWLPADIRGEGSIRFLLFANFSGRMHVTTSDYKRFRTSATIVGSHGAIGPDGQPVSSPDAAHAASPTSTGTQPSAVPRPQ